MTDNKEEVKEWLKKHNLDENIKLVVAVPNDKLNGIFYLRMENGLADKNIVDVEDEAKLVEWLKLTKELFM